MPFMNRAVKIRVDNTKHFWNSRTYVIEKCKLYKFECNIQIGYTLCRKNYAFWLVDCLITDSNGFSTERNLFYKSAIICEITLYCGITQNREKTLLLNGTTALLLNPIKLDGQWPFKYSQNVSQQIELFYVTIL